MLRVIHMTSARALFSGPGLVLRWGNDALWERVPRSALGCPLAEVFTDAPALLIQAAMRRVYATGRPWVLDAEDGHAEIIALDRAGERWVGTAWTPRVRQDPLRALTEPIPPARHRRLQPDVA